MGTGFINDQGKHAAGGACGWNIHGPALEGKWFRLDFQSFLIFTVSDFV